VRFTAIAKRVCMNITAKVCIANYRPGIRKLMRLFARFFVRLKDGTTGVFKKSGL
jgi:hypothetical protein